VAVVILTVWSMALALSGTYEQLFTYVMFASILFSVAAGAALFRLRSTRPSHPRPYKAWGYPVVPAIFVLGSLAFVLNTLIERPVESMIGLVLVFAGIPVFFIQRRTA
jgi:APA family basic amino acid/polyamine antiporter